MPDEIYAADPGDPRESVGPGAMADDSVPAIAGDLEERLAVAVVELEAEAVIRPPSGVRARGDQRRKRKAAAVAVTPLVVVLLTGGAAVAMRPSGGDGSAVPGTTLGALHRTSPSPTETSFSPTIPVRPMTASAAQTRRLVVVDLAGHTLLVYDHQAKARELPITAGGPNNPTRTGTFTVAGKKPVMTIGAQAAGIGSSHDYYNTEVHWYLDLGPNVPAVYAMPWRHASIGKENVGHGDIGLTDADAALLYDLVAVGDQIKVVDGPAG
jgi:lipoprotein-anchoring transpeptidase ErfK/SrfK